MIFTGFKRKSNQFFFNKTLPSLLKKEHESPFEEVKKVIIFLDENSEKAQIITQLVTILKIPESNIKVIVFKRNLKNEIETDDIITPKDFGWYGKFDSERVKNILTNKYDLLINYNKIDQFYTNLLVLQSNASFKVGFAHLKSGLYDLTIQCNHNEIELFTKEVKKYLKILKKI